MGQAGNVSPRTGKKGGRTSKNNGHQPNGHKAGYYRVSCVNPDCGRRQDTSGALDKDKSMSVGAKGIPKCPTCGTAIPKRGYV